MKRTGPTNTKTLKLIMELQKSGSEHAIWHSVARELARSTRARREVNLSKLNNLTKEEEVVLVPGKVLGTGELTHKITIAALAASQSALSKIKLSGSKYVPIEELIRKNPEGSDIRIIG